MEVRQERRIERGNNISLYKQTSTEVSPAGGKKKKTLYSNTSKGRKSSELQTYNLSSINRAVDGFIRLVLSQDNSQELKDNTPPLSFSFKLYTKAFQEKDVKTSVIFIINKEYTYNGSKDLNILKYYR